MADKYEPYLEYKETGIDWLPMIPVDWQVLPLKLASANKVKDGPHETPKFLDEGIPFFSVDGIQDCKLVFKGCRYISHEDHERFSMKCLPKFGDVLLGKAASVGKVAFVDTKEEFNVWSPLAVLTPKSVKLGRFIFYSLQSTWLQAQCDVNSNSNTQKNLSMGVIDNLSFAIPSDDLADKIANFLDHETAKIDTLIEKQQQLIKLLKEKCQAVISHAVTKGLNPNAPMRDSGVEWLGEVPEHWEVKRLKNTSEVVDCRNKTPEYFEDGEYFVVRTTNIKKQKLNMNGALYTNEANFKIWTQRGVPPAGSIFFTREAPAGEICLVPDNLKFCMGQRMMNFICNDPNYTSYLFDFLLSDCLERYIESVSHGSTVSHLRVEQVENIPVIVPPQDEAKAIHEELSIIKNKYLRLTEEAEKAIGLMQERRTALISTAVTGKIDVRHWAASA